MAEYFSIDFDSLTSQIFSFASTVVNMMMPIVALSAGFGLGFGLVDKIGKLFSRAI